MQTFYTADISEAAQILQNGGLVAFPTETVFGLGADARNPAAVRRIFQAKGRPQDNPLIVHLAEIEDWPMAAAELNPIARTLLQHFAPGPITVIVPKHPDICAEATAGLNSVGMRIPAADVTRELLRQAGVPVAAPSANLSGRPSGTTWRSVSEDLDGRVDAILQIDLPNLGLESSVVDCIGLQPVLLRPGAIGLNDLRRFFPDARMAEPSKVAQARVAQSSTAQSSTARSSIAPSNAPTDVLSPGLRHPHYQPRASVQLIDRRFDWTEWLNRSTADSKTICAFCGFVEAPQKVPADVQLVQVFASVADYARGYYEFLREADRAGATRIFVQTVDRDQVPEAYAGLAAALLDRQRRSAGQQPLDEALSPKN